MKPVTSTNKQDPDTIRRMFNAIAPTYDLLNHLLSFGLDIRWRRRAIRILSEKRGGAILDIAAGSGDLSLEVLSLQPRLVVSTDFAQSMLNVFKEKLASRNITRTVHLASCDALHLPFNEASFDATMVAFGIRNFADRLRSLEEMRRVLKPGGISLILELSAPTKPVVSQLYGLYSRIGLPLLGKIISRNNEAYRYLPESISAFPDREEFLALMARAGFVDSRAIPLTFGAAMIYLGRK
jgi:demethylmenaquinone methyltransferase/2-methoxy-6-polyprenyl-1,4-benzoquinol methylase